MSDFPKKELHNIQMHTRHQFRLQTALDIPRMISEHIHTFWSLVTSSRGRFQDSQSHEMQFEWPFGFRRTNIGNCNLRSPEQMSTRTRVLLLTRRDTIMLHYYFWPRKHWVHSALSNLSSNTPNLEHKIIQLAFGCFDKFFGKKTPHRHYSNCKMTD